MIQFGVRDFRFGPATGKLAEAGEALAPGPNANGDSVGHS